jgi:NADH-quinone oxidoreductase subunit E
MTVSHMEAVDLGPLGQILERYPKERASLVMVLQDVQRAYHYLPRPVLVQVARALGVPRAHVFHVASFYKHFSLKPRGAHTCTVCMGTACHVRGAKRLVEHLERRTGVRAGETTPDLNLTLETVNCVGACALGPVVILDGEYVGSATTAKTDRALKRKGILAVASEALDSEAEAEARARRGDEA